jgi:arylsulfatase A-like enzyme
MKRPNIVFVMADDVTPYYHGCYGGPTPTPAINRLAREGALFMRSHSVAPLCNPSRWSIFTGQVPGRAESCSKGCSTAEPYSVAQNADLQPDTPSTAKLLRSAGYFTGHVGKWHSNFAYLAKDEWPKDLGPDADLDDPGTDSKVRELQKKHQNVVRECAGFEWVDAVNWGNLGGKKPGRLGFHNPAWMTDAALSFLDEAAGQDKPFYLHLANTVPHGPDPNKSLGGDHRYTFTGKQEEPPQSHPHDATVLERLRKAGLQTEGPVAGINAGVMQIDDQIAALREKLEAMGELENTLFVYTADHGIHGKGTCYLGGYHMPLVMRWPGVIEAGRVINEPISHVDFLPTLAEIAGAEVPADHTLDGFSQVGLLRGESGSARDVTYQEMGVGRAVTKGSWRYIVFRYPESVIARMQFGDLEEPRSLQAYVEGPFCNYNFVNKPHYFEAEQLYNLDADPFERTNLAYNPGCAETLEDMRHELHAITDKLPGPYREDTPAFQKSLKYRRMVEERRLRVSQMSFYPDGYDQERIFNLNLPDPLARE